MFNKDIEELNNRQSAMNSTITEIKNTLGETNSRKIEGEEWISNLED